MTSGSPDLSPAAVPRAWIVKGNAARNDLTEMLVPGRTERWVTRRMPRELAAGDHVFFWKSSPARHLIGLGLVKKRLPPGEDGDTFFELEYLTWPFGEPIGIEELRRDAALAEASFLKSGPAGTVFPLTPRQAARLMTLVRRGEPTLREFTWPGESARPAQGSRSARASREPSPADGTIVRALSIRQPYAELILLSVKTIEMRSQPTPFRGRTYIYAGATLGGFGYTTSLVLGLGIDEMDLPRRVIVGSVEVVDCRLLEPGDWKAACFERGEQPAGYAWLLANPQRARKLIAPARHPQPVWFRPF